jgi:Xaa-Pro aminopeptidase
MGAVGGRLVATKNMIEELRMLKTPEELSAIRQFFAEIVNLVG